MRFRHHRFRHGLAEGDRGRLHDPAAEPAGRRPCLPFQLLPYPVELVARAAGEAAREGSIAVKLDELLLGHARLLVKIVDVLRDDMGRFAGLYPMGDGLVPAPRLCPAHRLMESEIPPPGFE